MKKMFLDFAENFPECQLSHLLLSFDFYSDKSKPIKEMQLPVKLLKEGTDTSQGIPQIVSNINACQVIGEAVKTTLGPRGMDKMIIDARSKVTQAFFN